MRQRLTVDDPLLTDTVNRSGEARVIRRRSGDNATGLQAEIPYEFRVWMRRHTGIHTRLTLKEETLDISYLKRGPTRSGLTGRDTRPAHRWL